MLIKRSSRRSLLAMTGIGLASLSLSLHAQDDTIKVGILHTLSGTMAISETTLKDTMLLLIDQQNAKGGLQGKKLGAVRAIGPCSPRKLAS